jgi:hypothetical protein
MDAQELDYARMVSLMAAQGILRHADAIEFCSTVLPSLLSELEILEGVANRLSQMIAAAISPPKEEAPEPQPAEKPKRPRSRRKKEQAK